MKKGKLGALLLTGMLGAALLLSGCGNREETPSPAASETPATESPAPAETTEPFTQGELFWEFAQRDMLAAVVYDPTEEDLKQLTKHGCVPITVNGPSSDSDYAEQVLILPKYGDGTVTVERITYNEDATVYTVDEVLGKLEPGESEDDCVGGVLICAELPEGIPDLLVTVEHGEETGSMVLGYDGRGLGLYYISNGDPER